MKTYTTKDIDKILGFTTWTDKRKLDALLKIDCALYCSLGKESTKAEKDEVKKQSRKIYKAIKTFDPRSGDMFLNAMDSK